jgi:hypothetical protein
VLQPRQRGYGLFVDGRYDENAAIDQVVISGPYKVDGPGDTPSRRAIFSCTPNTAAEETTPASVTASARQAGKATAGRPARLR